MNFFDGLYGYEVVMLGMGALLFPLAAFVLIRAALGKAGGSYPWGVVILGVVVVLAGYPSIQSVKFEEGKFELDKLARNGLPPNTTPEQKAAMQAQIDFVAQRSATPQLQAKVATAYKNIGDLDKAYDLASKVAAKQPSPAVSKELIPILTEKLARTTPADPEATVTDPRARSEIAKIATQLQAQTAPLPADSHLAIAQAQVVLGQHDKAVTSLQAAQQIDPGVRIDPRLRSRLAIPPAPGR